ncbi:transglutaminase [Psychromonas marina]|uniref:Transglutaminase n=1 Tax=Psychromonas marina TaxID=88364 RepID=A0ABQ6E2W0_9GAMM|nr:DUF3488 and transglutaminase-like domain-containing protein [Psychromonas marina]GLS91530.1 transglutaminase [Psychromonas marina]
MKAYLNRLNLTLIIVTYSVIVIVLLPQLSSYIVFIGITCAAWRIGHFIGRVALLSPLLLGLFAVAMSALTVSIIYSQGLFTLLLHLVFLGFSLKFLELRTRRDVYFFINTGFILTALFFIFNTSIGSALIASLLLLLLLATLLSLHVQQLYKKAFIKLLFKSCLISLPLASLLFVVIPRLPSLWKMPLQKQATTGLSDSVSPGGIAKLSRSSALAFRATFKDKVVPENERYWRAMTLDNFDGTTWSQSDQKKQQESLAKRGAGLSFYPTQKGNKVEYELIIEPHYNYWVPVLDYALTPSGLVSLSDYSLRSEQPIVTRKAFSIEQMDSVNTKKLTPVQIRQLTQLPTLNSAVENPQTEQWITDNLRKGHSKEQILRLLLARFSMHFTYTLKPPLLGKSQVDDFLFTTQAGFCVHYASSYLYVARRLGFPARMVTGYLGGEWQASEGFFTVRQYDAHAWVEIWSDGGWQRVDPTSFVAPERVESGLEASLTNSNEFLADELFSLQKWQSVELLNALRVRLAQMDYLWARYVVNFDNGKQLRLLQYWLAKFPWLNITYTVFLLMAAIFSALLLMIFKPWQRKKIALEDKLYLSLQSHFTQQGYPRQMGQSISDYCALLSVQKPSSAALLGNFAQRYNAIKYQPSLSETERKKMLRQLQLLIKQLIKI